MSQRIKKRYFLSKIVKMRAMSQKNGCKCDESRLHTLSHSANRYRLRVSYTDRDQYTASSSRNAQLSQLGLVLSLSAKPFYIENNN